MVPRVMVQPFNLLVGSTFGLYHLTVQWLLSKIVWIMVQPYIPTLVQPAYWFNLCWTKLRAHL